MCATDLPTYLWKNTIMYVCGMCGTYLPTYLLQEAYNNVCLWCVRYLPTCMRGMCIYSSVTRFGEISPLLNNFKTLGQIFEDLFSIWQHFNLTWAKNMMLFGKFSLFKIIQPSGHTDLLVQSAVEKRYALFTFILESFCGTSRPLFHSFLLFSSNSTTIKLQIDVKN